EAQEPAPTKLFEIESAATSACGCGTDSPTGAAAWAECAMPNSSAAARTARAATYVVSRRPFMRRFLAEFGCSGDNDGVFPTYCVLGTEYRVLCTEYAIPAPARRSNGCHITHPFRTVASRRRACSLRSLKSNTRHRSATSGLFLFRAGAAISENI